jgi:oxygen-independent coproporphyrinogen-3 oxidase
MNNSKLEKIKKDLFFSLECYDKAFADLGFLSHRLMSAYNGDSKSKFADTVQSSINSNNNIMIYIHNPFCFDGCVFCCAFPWKHNKKLVRKYFTYLVKEIEIHGKSQFIPKKNVRAIYFGGGTPTLFTTDEMAVIMDTIRKNFSVGDDCEVTSETHPLHITGQKGKQVIAKLRECGINRLSTGIQSFDNRVLKYCNRANTSEDAYEAVKNTKEANMFTNVDMMFGLPGQTLESVKDDLKHLERLEPDAIEYMRHDVCNKEVINLYNASPELLVAQDDLFEMNMITQKWMEKHGYEQNGYISENSRFYLYRYCWTTEVPYITLGAKAWAHLGTICYYKHRDLKKYFDFIDRGELPIMHYSLIPLDVQVHRTMLLRLQTSAGLDIGDFKSRYNDKSLESLQDIIEALKSYELIFQENNHIRLTQSYGRYFSEDVSNFILNKLKERVRIH